MAKHLPSKIALISLGCVKNIVDSEKLTDELLSSGFTVTADLNDCHGILVNTCGFIQPARDEASDTLEEIRALKKMKPKLVLVAMGCFVTKEGKGEVLDRFPFLDGAFSLAERDGVVAFFQNKLFSKKKIRVEGHFSEERLERRVSLTLPHYGYLKISEGCDRSCTFCTIPSIRGPLHSRKIDHLVDEVSGLSRRGVRELILIAQDLTIYGKDVYSKPVLLELLRELEKVEGIDWIRLMYAYPEFWGEELEDYICDSDNKVLPYLDMPIQHGSPDILKKMARASTFEVYRRVFSSLRSKKKDFALRTTLITGFPGENLEDHQKSLEMIQEIQFDRLGVFPYVHEKGTSAFKWEDSVSEEEKNRRFEELMIAQQSIHLSRNDSFVGQKLKVIIDGVDEDKGVYVGRSYRDAPDVDALVLVEAQKPLNAGDIYSISITGKDGYDLIGTFEQ